MYVYQMEPKDLVLCLGYIALAVSVAELTQDEWEHLKHTRQLASNAPEKRCAVAVLQMPPEKLSAGALLALDNAVQMLKETMPETAEYLLLCKTCAGTRRLAAWTPLDARVLALVDEAAALSNRGRLQA